MFATYTICMKQEEIKQLLAERIRSKRKLLGLTQEQLAENADLSHNYIARIEIGTKTPSVTTLFKIADALNVNPAELISSEPSTDTRQIENISFALHGLNKDEIEFVLGQLRDTTDYLKRHKH